MKWGEWSIPSEWMNEWMCTLCLLSLEDNNFTALLFYFYFFKDRCCVSVFWLCRQNITFVVRKLTQFQFWLCYWWAMWPWTLTFSGLDPSAIRWKVKLVSFQVPPGPNMPWDAENRANWLSAVGLLPDKQFKWTAEIPNLLQGPLPSPPPPCLHKY